MISRRTVLKTVALSSALPLVSLSHLSWADDKKIVVIGGGAAGVTFAKYLKKLVPAINITIVEKNTTYQPAFLANHLIDPVSTIRKTKFTYKQLEKQGIQVVQDEVKGIDLVASKINLSSGKNLAYDRLVLATGAGLKTSAINGFNSTTLHAWSAGSHIVSLADSVKSMQAGGVAVVSIPEGDISGPWAPYERVSLMANYFKRQNKKAKIVLSKAGAKSNDFALFEQYWKKQFSGMIDVQWESPVTSIESSKIVTKKGDIQADLLNIVAPNYAGKLASSAGLTDDTGWCTINAGTFESVKQKNIYIIGDAISSTSGLRKTAQSANGQAKLCAISMANTLQGKSALEGLPPLIDSEYCVLGPDYAVSRTRLFRVKNEKQFTMVSEGQSEIDAPEKQGKREVQYAYSWINNITQDMFG